MKCPARSDQDPDQSYWLRMSLMMRANLFRGR